MRVMDILPGREDESNSVIINSDRKLWRVQNYILLGAAVLWGIKSLFF